jgi:hypothetical protein
VRDFAEHANGRKQLRQEFFYRELRQKTGILMDGKKNPSVVSGTLTKKIAAALARQALACCPNPCDLSPTASHKM